MRLSHIEARLDQQIQIRSIIENAESNLNNVEPSEITEHRIQTRLNALTENWDKFQVIIEAILLASSRLTLEDKTVILEHSYFVDNLFQSTQELYLEAVEKMSILLDRIKLSQRRAYSDPQSIDASGSVVHYHVNSRLPPMSLPKFDGNPNEWLFFKDMFLSIVNANASLSNVERLQYLSLSLTGTAANFLKNTPLSSTSFEKAWDSLIQFYENPRIIIDSTFQSLISIKKLTEESATQLEFLYTSLIKIYRVFETLNRPVQHWDDFLVFLAVQKLDSASVKAWENHLGVCKDPPKWSRFLDFLSTRIMSSKAYERSIGNNSSVGHQKRAARTLHVQSSSEGRSVESKLKCLICQGNHLIHQCSRFKSSSISQKLSLIARHRLCYNCLGVHNVKQCSSPRRCTHCGRKHHTSIHQSSETYKNNGPEFKTDIPVHQVNVGIQDDSSEIIMATAKVNVLTSSGHHFLVKVLIDPGSQISLISESLVHQLNLDRQQSSIYVSGIGGIRAGKTRGKVSLTLKPYFPSRSRCSITARILKKLTRSTPCCEDMNEYSHLANLKLADPEFQEASSIDLLIGLDYYGSIMTPGMRKGPLGTPLAQSTIFGWIISGPFSSEFGNAKCLSVTTDDELHDLLERFWRIEDLGSMKPTTLNPDEASCEEHYRSTVTRDGTGRYIVRLPFRRATTLLGDSRLQAERSLDRVFRRFQRDSHYHALYSNFLAEYEQLNHMSRVPSSKISSNFAYYLPHHGVFRSGDSSKIRVVFNGSSPTTTGVSLNDLLHTGPKLQIDIFKVLLWFRQFPFVFTTDIQQMYRQILVHRDDWDFQRILWRNKHGSDVHFCLKTVTYGLSCAPFLALRTINQLIYDEGSNFPLAVDCLTMGRYVDDIFGGADTMEQASLLVEQLTLLCQSGGFPLKKWSSNNCGVLSTVDSVDSGISSVVSIQDCNFTTSTLGLSWNCQLDSFQSAFQLPDTSCITKRHVLSIVSRIFDPLGFLSPIVIRAKMLLQDLWSLKSGWDTELPPSLVEKWNDIIGHFREIPTIKIPRWLGIKSNTRYDFHGFCDASSKAYAAVIFVRIQDSCSEAKTSFLCAKTKVAPIKRSTIPRLELCGALLLSNLILQIIKTTSLSPERVFCWTDSSIVHTWINNHPSRWKEFVHNRVLKIQENLPNAVWNFVPGKENPADAATRGMTPQQLYNFPLWWNGPCWLVLDSANWPNSLPLSSHDQDLEQRPVCVNFASKDKVEYWDLLTRYSSLDKLYRVTALCLKCARRWKGQHDSSDVFSLSPVDLQLAKEFWVKQVQSRHFDSELVKISSGLSLPLSNSLTKLIPFLDESGVLRVGGRLAFSSLPDSAKHPIILPRDSPLTHLVIRNAHLRTLHGGTQLTLSYLRQDYWVIGGRVPVRSFILRCVLCTRYRQRRAQQLIGQLPATNVTASRPFLHSGVDYAGPFTLKTWYGRSPRTYKAYLALFVCMVTSAVHLELITSYTTEGFIAAYRRFTARRGICATLRSDCGPNFKGAEKELRKLLKSASDMYDEISHVIVKDGTKWIFNPPSAPHMGGKWEAAVKSVKYHLRRVLGDQKFTYEELATLLIQIEGILNSRPLSPLTDDPHDLNFLTPGHFLIGQSLSLIPEPSLKVIPMRRLDRWQLIQRTLQGFWDRWSKEYLQRYLATYKWSRREEPLKEGSLVIITDERFPPSKWFMGRITQLHPGRDGLPRVATLRTATTTLQRPIAKLCPLPVDTTLYDGSPDSLENGGRKC